MELSELTAYAEEKFYIREQRKWADFPGFSVLSDPNTGNWLALLMRQWDYDTGTEIQRCDIKCGQRVLSEIRAPYLSLPFRMKGRKWVGVRFEADTNRDVVFRLFDRAVYADEGHGYTIVLDTPPAESAIVCPDTALPASKARFSETELEIPEKIREMQRLYEGSGSFFAVKCKNFYRQGKFMEDYEDDAPCDEGCQLYFPDYHELNLRQLRGYFTWRTHVRKGIFLPVASSLAYMYIYELLNGIGTDSPEDSLQKMGEFETGFLDSGMGCPGMDRNLHRWMLEYAVLHDIPPALARRYADPALIEGDEALAVLRSPEEFNDGEIFSALCIFAGKKLERSPVVKKGGERGKHFFAAVWRCASRTFSGDGKDFFAACFGEQKAFSWHPLGNALYWEEQAHPDADYILDACREYHCRSGVWQEKRYDSLYFDRDRFRAFLRATDRILRKYLKTGHYLRENAGEAWVSAYVEAVIQAERREERKAAVPEVIIDLSHLEQIRQDAQVTRDSLLTGEEVDAEADADDSPAAQQTEEVGRPDQEKETDPGDGLLDMIHRQILLALARNQSAEPYLKAGHLMPSVAADTINEALFDEIGDNVLEWDGDTITLVEDYRDDVLQMFGGKDNE